jgi:segregation and condensation protein B
MSSRNKITGAPRNAAAFCAFAFEQVSRASSELDRAYLRGAIEALVFAAQDPISLRELMRSTKARKPAVLEVLEELMTEYADRGVNLLEVHGGYCFLTNPAFSIAVRGVTAKKPVRLTKAQLETLSIVAYRQPITRPEIDEIRGVDSGPVLRLLLERELIRVLGKKEEPGRPLLYGTAEGFLTLFNLKSLADLPTLREFTELTEDSKTTYERRLGEQAPAGDIVFDDEPDSPIDPTEETDDEEDEPSDAEDDAGEDDDEDAADEDEDEDLDEDEDENEDVADEDEDDDEDFDDEEDEEDEDDEDDEDDDEDFDDDDDEDFDEDDDEDFDDEEDEEDEDFDDDEDDEEDDEEAPDETDG